MNTMMNEMKIPTLVLAIFMGILSIARSNANYLWELESASRQTFKPIEENPRQLACGIVAEEPLDLGDIFEVSVDDE